MANCASRSAVSTWVSISASAVSILRSEVAVTRPRAEATRLAVSNVPNLVAMIGKPQTQPGHQRRDRRVQLQPTVEDDARQRRKAFGGMGTHDSEHDIGSVARRDDGHALLQPLQHMLGGHARHQHMHRLARQQRRIAADHGALDGFLQLGHRWGDQQRLLGQHVALRLELLQRGGHRVHLARVAAVGHHRRGVCVLGRNLGQTYVDDLGDLIGGAVLGLHRQHDGRRKVGSDARVRRQLARCGDVGVVAADDQHRIAPVGHPVIPVDDVADRGVRVLVQLLVADADAVLVGQARGGVRKQQLQDVVTLLAQPGDRAEHTDLGDGGRQPVQDAERDRRLAGVTLWRSDVDRGWHA